MITHFSLVVCTFIDIFNKIIRHNIDFPVIMDIIMDYKRDTIYNKITI